MYKAFLSLRYLRTRYIAMASIVSVMLGVATMIVVNSVMKGFTSEMRSRIQGLLSDIVIETNSLNGAENARKMFADVRSVAGDKVSGMTATVEVWGLITFPFAGQYTTRPVTLIGIQPEEKATVGPFKQYLESYNPILDGKQIKVRALLQRSADARPGWELTSDATKLRSEIKQREKYFKEHIETESPEFNSPKSGLVPVNHSTQGAAQPPPAVAASSKQTPAPLPANAAEKKIPAPSSDADDPFGNQKSDLLDRHATLSHHGAKQSPSTIPPRWMPA